MKIPEKVLISGLWYTVERVDGTFLDGITACDGIHSYSEQLIKVVKSGSEHYQNIVFYMRYCTQYLRPIFRRKIKKILPSNYQRGYIS